MTLQSHLSELVSKHKALEKELAEAMAHPASTDAEIAAIMLGHLRDLYDFYGDHQGLRIARKHLGWYAKTRADGDQFRREVVRFDAADAQYDYTARWLAGETWAQAA